MEAGASADSLISKNMISEDQFPNESPVQRLAEYIYSVRELEDSISFPQSLLVESIEFHRNKQPLYISTTDTTALVDALDDNTSNLCNRLDELAFQTTYSFLRISEPCLAKQRGHCLFVESLHPSRAKTLSEKASLKARKVELGKHVLSRLIKAFLDQTRHPRDRRWTGSLALELLKDCGRNKEILSTTESNELRYQLGELVIVENHESLRLMAGTIIREMVDVGYSAKEFWDPEKYPGPPSIFENILEKSSQWTTDFVTFIDTLETQGIVSKERKVSAFAYAVYFDKKVYNTRAGLSLLVTLVDELTIIVPSTQSDSAKYIDIPPTHISAVRLEQGQPGSQPEELSRPTATVLSIDLRGMADAAFYVNEVTYQSSQIFLAFDTLKEATFIKERIEAFEVSQRESRAGRTTGLGTASQTMDQPTEVFSQSAYIDISSYPDRKAGVQDQHIDSLRSIQLRSQTSQASGAANRLMKPASNESNQASSRGKAKDHFVDKSASHVLVATEVVDVSQGSHQGVSRNVQGDDQGDDFDPEPTSSTAWRDGMQAIETAKELDPHVQHRPPNTSANTGTMVNRDMVLDPNDDLYSATPTGKKGLSDRGANDEIREPPSIPSVASSKPTARKLSRSMRVGENEKSSVPPPPSRDKGGTAKKSRGSIGKTHALAAKLPGVNKRKNNVVDDAGPSKKRKNNGSNSADAATDKVTHNSTTKPAAYDVYDIPSSPEQARSEVGKSAGKKPKLSDGGAKTRTTAKTSKPASATTRPVKSASKTKAPRVTKATKAKQVDTSTAIDRDQDVAANTDSCGDGRVDEEDVKPSKDQSQKRGQAIIGKGRITKKSQSSKPSTKKNKAKEDIPSRSPRKPRAAAQKAKKKMLAIDSNDDEENGPSREDNSIVTGMAIIPPQAAASSLSESLLNDEEAFEDAKTHITGKMQINLNVKNSVGSDAKSTANADKPTASRKINITAENLVSYAQSAMKTKHLTNDNGGIPDSEDPSSLSISVTENQEVAHQVAPSKSDSILPIQQGLDSDEHDTVVLNTSSREHMTGNPVSKTPSPSMSDGCNLETMDTHFQDVIAPLTIDAAHLFVDHHHTPVEDNMDINRDYQSNTHAGPAADGMTVAQVIPAYNNQHKDDHSSGKVFGADARNGRDEVAIDPQYATKNAMHEDSKPLDPLINRIFIAQTREQGLEWESYQPQPQALDNGLKIVSKDSLRTQADGDGSIVRDPPNDGDRPYPNEHPFNQIQHPVMSQGVPMAEPVGEIIDSNNTHGRLGGSSHQQSRGSGDHEVDELGSRHSQRMVAPKTIRSLSPRPSRSFHLPKVSLPLEAPNAEYNDNNAKRMADHDVGPSDILSDHPTISQLRASWSTSRPLPEQPPLRKRPAETANQLQFKKRKLSPQATPTSRTNPPTYETHKDPSRIPQVISFSAKGPRNQGVHSPAVSLGTPFAAHYPRVQQSTPNGIYPSRKDAGTMTVDEPYIVHRGRLSNQGAERTRLEPQDGDANEIPVLEPANGKKLQPVDKTRNLLLDHEDLFVVDDWPKVSSQSSRVAENGSPMPAKRKHGAKSEAKDLAEQRVGPSVYGGFDTPFGEGETTFVHKQDDESPELELPQIIGPGDTRKKHVGFIGSSNSKHRPSSPSAPSAMLTEVEVHLADPQGQLVNMETDKVLVPSNLQDPFASKEGKQPTTFMEKLRHASNVAHEEAQRSKATEQHRETHFATAEEDPDETLIGIRTDRSKRPVQDSPTTASTSSTSQSNNASQTSKGLNGSDAVYGRWRAALEPHQENMLTVLCEISHGLFGHLMDAETAINDVVKDFQRQGQRYIKDLADDLERELSEYREAVSSRRRREILETYESLDSNITKNLQRKSEVESVAAQLEERQKKIDEQMNAAFLLCGEDEE